MAVNLASSVTSFLIAFVVLPLIIRYMMRNKILDAPDSRKVHKVSTPSLGGIAIFAGFMLSTLVFMDFSHWDNMRYILASLFLVFLIGVRDDVVPFKATHKLFGQLVAIAVLCISTVRIDSFYGLLGIETLPAWVSYGLTGFSIVIITNAFNLIDGLDGLAGSVGLVALGAFGIWFYAVDDLVFSMMCFSLIGGILAFLIYNWQPAVIFMGDTGAMVIGMMLSILAIRFMNVNAGLPDENPWQYNAPIATAASFIIVPLTDTLRIIILRLSRGQSPFKADKSHIHHALMGNGYTHGETALILAAVSTIFVVLAWVCRDYSDKWLIPAIVVSAALFGFLVGKIKFKKSLTAN
ncbi:MAG: undecaprenyl/decaprenyl-phosphate alpha-N-acetylglucosaminyl 1-phosphate transferase [Cyclobacteriaceae bacterium]|nr:undecaprenyl/decaprenyl-phosphate alpha-N-acetylglucosaminyl 1-phosphate transferase [Cyclobacteriaceae bacterium]